MNIDELTKELDNVKNLTQLSNSFDKITKSFDKTCEGIYNLLFDYQFSNFLFYEYIILNKTKVEIGEELNLSPSTVYYYIRKYKIKKDKKLVVEKILESTKKTCNYKYNVNHPGELPEAHRKRIENILYKSNNNYTKAFYDKLGKSDETVEKMKIAQQLRRQRERSGDNNG